MPAKPEPEVNAISVFLVSDSGLLIPRQVLATGFDGETLLNQLSAEVSPDGRHVYSASFPANSVNIFERDNDDKSPTFGVLTPVGIVKDSGDNSTGLVGARFADISPDGLNVYVAGAGAEGSVVGFVRNPDTGLLSEPQIFKGGFGDGRIRELNNPRHLEVSPDGRHLYVASTGLSSILAFSRTPGANSLTLVEVQSEQSPGQGLNVLEALAVSPDGSHVYTASPEGIGIFLRDRASGSLTFQETVDISDLTSPGQQARVQYIRLSPTGSRVYLAGGGARFLAIYNRDRVTGSLSLLRNLRDGELDDVGQTIDGLQAVQSMALSPDNRAIYVVNSGSDSILTFFQQIGPAAINSSVLPTTRVVRAGETATAFVAVANTTSSGVRAFECRLFLSELDDFLETVSFSYQPTDPNTNTPVGPANFPPPPIRSGELQTYVISITPTQEIDPPRQIDVAAQCDNTRRSVLVPNVSTLTLASTSSQLPQDPDVIAVAETAPRPGELDIRGNDVSAFSLATINVGGGGSVTVVPNNGADASPELTLSICGSDPLSGNCITPVQRSITATYSARQTRTFGVFAAAPNQPTIPNPTFNRINVDVVEVGGSRLGGTSLAYNVLPARPIQPGDPKPIIASIDIPGPTSNLPSEGQVAISVTAEHEGGPNVPLDITWKLSCERSGVARIEDPKRPSTTLIITNKNDQFDTLEKVCRLEVTVVDNLGNLPVEAGSEILIPGFDR